MTRPAQLTVLIVDDELLIRFHLGEVFEEQGWNVIEAASAIEAVQLLAQTHAAAVITDIDMPGDIDGIDLTWQIYGQSPRTPVIVTSARILPQKANLPPGTVFLAKPVPGDVLVAILRERLSS